MKIKKVNFESTSIEALIQEIKHRVEDNEENRETIHGGYDEGYMEGYHDAMIEILNYLGVEHDQEYYN